MGQCRRKMTKALSVLMSCLMIITLIPSDLSGIFAIKAAAAEDGFAPELINMANGQLTVVQQGQKLIFNNAVGSVVTSDIEDSQLGMQIFRMQTERQMLTEFCNSAQLRRR